MNINKLMAVAAMAAMSVTVNLDGQSLTAGGIAENEADWLLDPSPYAAKVETTADACVLDNGLVRRVVTLKPLSRNLAHYEQRFANLLGAGIQAFPALRKSRSATAPHSG